ncbi:MAG: hypothetical protein IRZ21_12235 [Thermoleophilaceae bacterium]|nr:hypothetical protein [Thermoleophilaceae bacterium]
MRKLPIGASLGVAALATAAVAVASPQFKQTASAKFTTTRPGASSGLSVDFRASDPGAPNGKPPAATNVRVTLPRGARVDTRAVRLCRASDSQIMQRGVRACPTRSRLGTGSAAAITGLGSPVDPVGETVTAFAARNQIVFYLAPKSAVGQNAVLRARIRGRVVDVVVPPFPLPGGGSAALTSFRITLKAHSSGRGRNRRSLLTTPSTCPRSHRWVTTVRFAYDDGTTKTIDSRSSCR